MIEKPRKMNLELQMLNLERDKAELLEALDLALEDRDYFEQELRKSENIVLNYLKDKERLDWLLNDASMAHLCWAANGREQIDQAMEEAIREREAANHI